MNTITITPEFKKEVEATLLKAFDFSVSVIQEMIKAGLSEEQFIFRLQKRIVCAYHITPQMAMTTLEGAMEHVNKTRV